MGLMKEYLMKEITEYARLIGVDEEAIYKDDVLYGCATMYAKAKLAEECKEGNNGN